MTSIKYSTIARFFLLNFTNLFIFSSTGLATLNSLPETHHKRFLTFGLFFDEKSGFLIRNREQSLGSFGSSMALMEEDEWIGKPQLVLTGGVDVAFKTKDYINNLNTEAFDARFGIAIDSELSRNFLLSFGLLHYSGHVADGTSHAELIPYNLGDDSIFVRAIYDEGEYMRAGGTLRIYIHTDPPLQFISADQFIEFFPSKNKNSKNEISPFIAFGLEEGGPQKIDFTYHIQSGFYLGNHTLAKRESTFRIALGYYNGADPRFKFAHILNAKDHFIYGGVILNY